MNAQGIAPIAAAVMSGQDRMIRRLEKEGCLVAGEVSVKTRYAVVLKLIPFNASDNRVLTSGPKSISQLERPPALSSHLWLFKNMSGSLPKTMIVLNGATATLATAKQDARVVLHRSQEQPKNIYSKFLPTDGGCWAISLRPAAATQPATATLERLLQLSHQPNSEPPQPLGNQPCTALSLSSGNLPRLKSSIERTDPKDIALTILGRRKSSLEQVATRLPHRTADGASSIELPVYSSGSSADSAICPPPGNPGSTYPSAGSRLQHLNQFASAASSLNQSLPSLQTIQSGQFLQYASVTQSLPPLLSGLSVQSAQSRGPLSLQQLPVSPHVSGGHLQSAQSLGPLSPRQDPASPHASGGFAVAADCLFGSSHTSLQSSMHSSSGGYQGSVYGITPTPRIVVPVGSAPRPEPRYQVPVVNQSINGMMQNLDINTLIQHYVSSQETAQNFPLNLSLVHDKPVNVRQSMYASTGATDTANLMSNAVNRMYQLPTTSYQLPRGPGGVGADPLAYSNVGPSNVGMPPINTAAHGQVSWSVSRSTSSPLAVTTSVFAPSVAGSLQASTSSPVVPSASGSLQMSDSFPVSLGRVSHLNPRPDICFELDLERDVEIYPDQVLGSGATGVVVKGKYQGRIVAVKMIVSLADMMMRSRKALSPSAVADYAPVSKSESEDPSFNCEGADSIDEARCVEHELLIMARLDHPNIVRIYGGRMRPPTRFLVEELCTMPLSNHIHKRGAGNPLPMRDVFKIALDIIAGLCYLHSLDIIHRDMKPHNVLLDASGQSKIADFGLARCKYKTYLSTKKIDAGTVAYMAPEAFNDTLGGVSCKADVYSFGVMLNEMVTHTQPWKNALDYGIIYHVAFNNSRPDPCDDPLRCPQPLMDLIEACWAQDPNDRMDAVQVLDCLTHIQSACLPPADHVHPIPPSDHVNPSASPSHSPGPSSCSTDSASGQLHSSSSTHALSSRQAFHVGARRTAQELRNGTHSVGVRGLGPVPGRALGGQPLQHLQHRGPDAYMSQHRGTAVQRVHSHLGEAAGHAAAPIHPSAYRQPANQVNQGYQAHDPQLQLPQLHDSQLYHSQLHGPQLHGPQLHLTHLHDPQLFITLSHTALKSMVLSYTTLSFITLRPTTLSYTTLSSMTLRSTTLSYTTLSSMTLKSTTLSYTTLSSMTLRSTTLSYTTLSSMTLKSTTLSYTTLSSMTLRSTTLRTYQCSCCSSEAASDS
eukprot:gene1412-32784_t